MAKTEWASDGQEHCLIHRKAPTRWAGGFPLGNGTCGVMVWGDGNPLAFTLDNANLWDLRVDDDFMHDPDYTYDNLRRLVAAARGEEVQETFETRGGIRDAVTPTKVSIGRAELQLGAAEEYECSLDVDTAMVRGKLQIDGTAHEICAFVHRDRNVFCLHVDDVPDGAQLRLIPLMETGEEPAELQHPAPQMHDDGEMRVLVQEIPEGPWYAVAWNVSGPDFFMAIEVGDSGAEVMQKATATHREAVAKGFAGLMDEHVTAWRAFWSVSGVYLPEPEMEFLWYYGLYLLASSSRRGSLPPGLQGVWAVDGVKAPWRGDYHADMNVQETFWPAGASGHVDLMDNWCDLMHDAIPKVQEFTRKFFGTEGTFWVCSTLPDYTMVFGWGTVQLAWSNTGWLAWVVWLRWRYSMDREWLRGIGYPVMSELFRFYAANLEEEEDGCLHIPLSSSPEYKENKLEAWCKDPNIDIALIRRCCDWLMEMEAALGIDELSQTARKVHEKLVPYSLTEEKVLRLWPGKPLDESHRHPSHLMAIHPAMDLTIEGSEKDRAIIEASLRHFFELGQYRWAGHTYAQFISFAAVLGRSGWAYDSLRQFYEHWIGPNGLHFNRDFQETGMTIFACPLDGYAPFTMEANCGVSQGICDMLVQGWGDIVRIFPAVPDRWRDVASVI